MNKILISVRLASSEILTAKFQFNLVIEHVFPLLFPGKGLKVLSRRLKKHESTSMKEEEVTYKIHKFLEDVKEKLA